MARDKIALEWRAMDDEEWQSLDRREQVPEGVGAPTPDHMRRLRLGVLTMLLLAVSVVWTGQGHRQPDGPDAQSTSAGRVAKDVEMAPTVGIQAKWRGRVAIDPTVPPAWRKAFAQEIRVEFNLPAEVVAVQQNGQTIAADLQFRVPTASGSESIYRQTRFYRQSGEGWLRLAPVAEFWGGLREIETDYFTLQFHARDHKAALALAKVIDDHYLEMRRLLGLPLPFVTDRTRLEISATKAPDFEIGLRPSEEPTTITSPALLLRPAALSETDLLREEAVLLLGEQLLHEYRDRRRARIMVTVAQSGMDDDVLNFDFNDSIPAMQFYLQWKIIGLAVDAKHSAIFSILEEFDSESESDPRQSFSAHKVSCAQVTLLVLSSTYLSAPSSCQDGANPTVAYLNSAPRLADLMLPCHEDLQSCNLYAWRRASTWATVFDYIETAYGQKSLHRFWHELARRPAWAGLIRAVFDQSTVEFEEGWRHYLRENYLP